ncbi:hypothetical protein KI659_12660 [Litoribacter alkaliphilus]|uniref:Uncharacterized protein n=1 Tax=Litoribacter ruber TaxID=702568 RepID=A0AAP2CN89_9BACT|nr:hypothetical protein [Litoribacter alkaliphilus]MBS9524862.1 hypothetical protein [Litoribacter alkaliphilus]
MKKILLGLLLCLVGNLSFAQLRVYNDMASGAPVMKDAFTGINGDHFFHDFAEGIIIHSKKDSAQNMQVRLNAHDHRLEYLKQGEVFSYGAKDIRGFIVNENGRNTYYTSEYVIPHLKDKAFTKVLAEGDEYKLIEFKHKVIVDDPNATYGAAAKKAFSDRVSHYIVKDEEVKQLSNRNKQLKEVFGDDYDRVKEIQKNSGLNLKDPDHLRVVVNFLNDEK